MDRRLELQAKLEELLGYKHVYYQPPENLKMEYPAIRYSRSKIVSTHADNTKYHNYNCYDLVMIGHKPDNEVVAKILELPYTYYDRHYVYDNLHHDIIRIYY